MITNDPIIIKLAIHIPWSIEETFNFINSNMLMCRLLEDLEYDLLLYIISYYIESGNSVSPRCFMDLGLSEEDTIKYYRSMKLLN